MNGPTVKEVTIVPQPGWTPLFVSLGMIFGPIPVIIMAAAIGGVIAGLMIPLVILCIPAGLISLFGLMAIAPNDSRVLLLFGEYKGSVVESGFYWVNPFYSKKKVSRRVRNFETGSSTSPEQKDAAGQILKHKSRSAGKPSKVNDRDGNPIEISAVVVWKVTDTAEALFEVDDFEDFVAVQSEAALRNLATRYPYDSEDHEDSLRGTTGEICDRLREDIQERLADAGVTVLEARISHLAYAPEIAAAMLQRQQAGAIVAVGVFDRAVDRSKRGGSAADQVHRIRAHVGSRFTRPT